MEVLGLPKIMTKYYCAVDGGNSSINIVINGKVFDIVFPSIESEFNSSLVNYDENTLVGNDNDFDLHERIHALTTLQIDNPGKEYVSEFIFGEMVENYPQELRSRPNKEKYQDKDLVKMMITSLAYALFDTKVAEERYKLEENDRIQFNVVLSTGLPYREMKSPEKRNIYTNLLKGNHRVNFKHPFFKNLQIDLIIEHVLCVLEGEMALSYELKKENGVFNTRKKEDLLNNKMAIIDIGGHTTEIVTISYMQLKQKRDRNQRLNAYNDDVELKLKQVTNADLTSGINQGVATMMEDVINDLTSTYLTNNESLRPLARRDVELALTSAGMYNGERGWILPEKIYIKDILDKRSQKLAVAIADKFHSLFNRILTQLDTIYLCGGGSEMDSIVSNIKKELNSLGYNADKIITINDPVFANVKGYYLAMTYFIKDCEPLKE